MKLICIRSENTSGSIVKGQAYEVMEEGYFLGNEVYFLTDFGLTQPFLKNRFAPITDQYADMTAEIAQSSVQTDEVPDKIRNPHVHQVFRNLLTPLL